MLDRAIARLKLAAPDPAQWPQSPGFEAGLRRLALASDFAVDTLCRQPELLALLAQGDPLPLPALDPLQPSAWPVQLRRYRAAASTRLVWRAVNGL
ncbi:MAG TPA: glutamine-synthetase adenylyltransferase, partial [Stenotrophomonas sp.]|nr:glutamine-synthetase adenylyltransferase [Stenotrophomonas sp.]